MRLVTLMFALMLFVSACGGDGDSDEPLITSGTQSEVGSSSPEPSGDATDNEPASDPEPTGNGTVLLVAGFDGVDRVDLDAETQEPFIEGLGQVGKVVVIGDSLWIQHDTSLTRADASSGDVAGTIELPDFPLQVAEAGDVALVLYGIPGISSSVAVIDSSTMTETGTIAAPDGTSYLSIAASDGHVWAIGGNLESSAAVSKLDASSLAQTISVDIGIIPDWISGGDGGIWVGGTIPGFSSDSGFPESGLAKLDPASGDILFSISLGEPADFIVVETGFGHLWASEGLEGTLLKIDPATGDIVDEVDTGDGAAGIPLEIIFTADYVWVFNNQEDTLTAYDPDSLEFETGINVPPFAGAPVFAP